jgi:DNA processing protein
MQDNKESDKNEDSGAILNGIRELEKSAWPERLFQIPQQPEKLTIRGPTPDWDQKFLCVVGARKYSHYGRQICETLIAGLSGYPITIVSGLAFGIDGIAHQAALDAGLVTIAVPGSGLNQNIIYPRAHRRLAEDILCAGGSLISEFEPNFKARPESFPQRNRIMAGLSHAVLIIEAELRSGTLITSRLATDYNRDVGAVPGSVFSKNSEGPHMLLRLGATPITNSEDILELLGLESKDAKWQASPQTKEQSDKDLSTCTEDEKKILDLLSQPLPREMVIKQLPFPVSQTTSILMTLELRGLIQEKQGQLSRSDTHRNLPKTPICYTT